VSPVGFTGSEYGGYRAQLTLQTRKTASEHATVCGTGCYGMLIVQDAKLPVLIRKPILRHPVSSLAYLQLQYFDPASERVVEVFRRRLRRGLTCRKPVGMHRRRLVRSREGGKCQKCVRRSGSETARKRVEQSETSVLVGTK
jgi:hypothetical protein